jgi:hypothetical protein
LRILGIKPPTVKAAAQAALEGKADVAERILKPQDRLPAMRQRRSLVTVID